MKHTMRLILAALPLKGCWPVARQIIPALPLTRVPRSASLCGYERRRLGNNPGGSVNDLLATRL